MALVRDFNLEYGADMPKIGYAGYDNMYTGLTQDPSSTLYTPAQKNSGFGWNNQTLGTVFSGLNALTGLANAFMGYKAYGLAKDQFRFQKGLANRQLANQAKMINNAYDTAAQVAAGMRGSVNADGTIGMTDKAIVDQYAARAKERHVDGSPI